MTSYLNGMSAILKSTTTSIGMAMFIAVQYAVLKGCGKNEGETMYTEKDNKKVSILGTEYDIKFVPEGELQDIGADGATDNSIKLIRVGVFVPQKCSISDLEQYQKKVLRHEIIHAFLYQSWLNECSGSVDSWANNETMIDWFAHQHKKIHKAFKQAGAV